MGIAVGNINAPVAHPLGNIHGTVTHLNEQRNMGVA